jgi:hypothetical protein
MTDQIHFLGLFRPSHLLKKLLYNKLLVCSCRLLTLVDSLLTGWARKGMV